MRATRHSCRLPSSAQVKALFRYKGMDKTTLVNTFDYDGLSGFLYWKGKANRRAGKKAGFIASNGYQVIALGGKRYSAHRLIWVYFNGLIPPDFDIDHINGIKDDNRIENLRLCKHAENMQNRRKAHSNSSTGFLGVWYEKSRKKYVARIALDNKDKYLGRFDTAEEASAAYLKAKRELHPFSTI